MPNIMTDWASMQKRLEERVAKAKDRRDRADFDVALAERDLEALKQRRRAAEGK